MVEGLNIKNRIKQDLFSSTKLIRYKENMFNYERQTIRFRRNSERDFTETSQFKSQNLFSLFFILYKSCNFNLKKQIILNLAKIKSPISEILLIDLLLKSGYQIKHYIVYSLGKIRSYKSLDYLIEMLSNKKLNHLLKKNIIIALGRIGDKRAVDILIELLKDPHYGMEDYVANALRRINSIKSLLPLIDKYLHPFWFSKEFYEIILNDISSHWKSLLKDLEYRIYKKKEIQRLLGKMIKSTYDWHYGYLNKSHYMIDRYNRILGCLNLIFMSIYQGYYLFYLDTIEIKRNYRRKGLGFKLVKYIINNDTKKYKKFQIFLLVANCEQYKMKFFSKLGFLPTKLRKTQIGTHCIMVYPLIEKSQFLCERLFEYFNWREEKKKFISSDCRFAYNPNPTGLYWCDKKKIYVTGLEKQNCKFYHKDQDLLHKKYFLDLTKL